MTLHEKFMRWFAKQLSPRFKLIVLGVMAQAIDATVSYSTMDI